MIHGAERLWSLQPCCNTKWGGGGTWWQVEWSRARQQRKTGLQRPQTVVAACARGCQAACQSCRGRRRAHGCVRQRPDFCITFATYESYQPFLLATYHRPLPRTIQPALPSSSPPGPAPAASLQTPAARPAACVQARQQGGVCAGCSVKRASPQGPARPAATMHAEVWRAESVVYLGRDGTSAQAGRLLLCKRRTTLPVPQC